MLMSFYCALFNMITTVCLQLLLLSAWPSETLTEDQVPMDELLDHLLECGLQNTIFTEHSKEVLPPLLPELHRIVLSLKLAKHFSQKADLPDESIIAGNCFLNSLDMNLFAEYDE
jgi:hypothetical protein